MSGIGITAARTRQVVTSDGARIAVFEFDPPQADPDLPVLVLAHGWTLSHETWLPVVADLQRRLGIRVVAYDQPGHGRSRLGDGPAEVRDLGHVLQCVLDAAVPTGRIVLAGHSMGGMTVMAWGGLYPDEVASRLAGVALVATAPNLSQRKAIRGEAMAMRVLTRIPGPVPRIPGLSAQMVRNTFGPNPDPEHVAAAGRIMRRTSARTTGLYFGALNRLDEDASLAAFASVPTHVVAGRRDRLISHRWVREYHATMPWAHLTMIEGVGHMPMYEATGEVADVLAGLLTGEQLPGNV